MHSQSNSEDKRQDESGQKIIGVGDSQENLEKNKMKWLIGRCNNRQDG